MKKFAVLLLALAMILSLAACGQAQTTTPSANTGTAEAPAEKPYDGKTWIIKAAVTQSDNGQESAEISWLKSFKAEVEEKTQGAVTVDIYPGGQLGTDAEVVQGLSGNTIEVGFFNYSNLNSVYAPTMLMSCPGVFSSEAECNAIMNGEWGTAFHDEMEAATGLKIIACFSNGFRCFTCSTKPLTTVDTAKGVTFRTMTSPVSIVMVEALGANAVPMASSEMYTAMQNGTVDGQENPIVNILNDKTYEVQKYFVMDKHIASIAAVGMSSKFYTELPAEIQEIVLTAAQNANAPAEEIVERVNNEGLAKLEEYGMECYIPTEDELAAWHEAIAEPCMNYVRGEIGDDVVDSLQTAIDAYRAG